MVYNAPKRRRGRRHHRRHYRRNPGGGGGVLSQLKGMAPKVGWGVVGAVGTEAIPSFAGRFMPLPTGQVGVIATKAASGVLTSILVRRFVGREQGNAALLGALLSLAIDPAKNMLLPMIGVAPAVGAYTDIGAYLPSDSGVGYLGPAVSMGDQDDSSEFEAYDYPNRLQVDERL